MSARVIRTTDLLRAVIRLRFPFGTLTIFHIGRAPRNKGLRYPVDRRRLKCRAHRVPVTRAENVSTLTKRGVIRATKRRLS